MPVGDICPMAILKVKDLEHWVHNRHRNFMATKCEQSGEHKLDFYTTAQAPVLNDPMDLASGAVESGDEWIIWTEYYAKMAGLVDHWKQGAASGMLPDFFGMMGPDKAIPQFVQPLQVLHEINNLIETPEKPKASMADLSGACQLVVMLTVPKADIDEAQELIDKHAVWMKALHTDKKMLDADVTFTPDQELLYYTASSCNVLNDQSNLDSGDHPDSGKIFLFTEYYKTKAGLENHWGNAHKMIEATGEDFTLGRMMKLKAKGTEVQFFQPMNVVGSMNWF